MVVIGVDQHRVQPGGAGARDIHRHGISDVQNPGRIELSEVRQRVVEDPRVGFGDADHVAVDDDAHRHPGTITSLTDSGSEQDLLDLTARVRHHAHRNVGVTQQPQRPQRLRDRPTPQMGRARVVEHLRGVLEQVAANSDGSYVGDVVGVPVALVGSSVRLVRHSGVVRPPVGRRVVDTPVRRQQRAEHRRIRQHQNAAGIEQHGVETSDAVNH